MIRDHIEAHYELFDEAVVCGLSDYRVHPDGLTVAARERMERVARCTSAPLLNGLNPYLARLAAEGRLAWSRGFVNYVRVTFDELMDHAGEIFLSQPVTAVDLLEREPVFRQWPEHFWIRANDSEELYDSPAALHGELFDPLVAARVNGDTKFYPTRLAALDALSAVCVMLGRREAGLA